MNSKYSAEVLVLMQKFREQMQRGHWRQAWELMDLIELRLA